MIFPKTDFFFFLNSKKEGKIILMLNSKFHPFKYDLDAHEELVLVLETRSEACDQFTFWPYYEWFHYLLI